MQAQAFTLYDIDHRKHLEDLYIYKYSFSLKVEVKAFFSEESRMYIHI